MKISAPSLSFALLAAAAAPLFAANSSLIQSPLTNTGVDADASGRVISKLGTSKSEFIVSVAKLSRESSYEVEVGGIVEATFTTNGGGGANVKFRTPKPGGGPLLDFDPRGKLLRVLSAGQSVLEATLASEGEPNGAIVVERANLQFGAAQGVTGKATADYRLDKKGRRRFEVEVERAGPGPFELFVGGIKRGDFTTRGSAARIEFAVGSDDAGVLPLDFDPRGEVIDIIRGGTTIFSSQFAAQATGVNVASPRMASFPIPSTGADADGHATAELRIDDRARKHFSVEVEDVAAGSYELLVDSVSVGEIVVTATTKGTKGEVEFTAGDDDPEELPLTFDPVGKTLTIKQGAITFFEGLFTPDLGNGNGTPAAEAPSELEEMLATTGLDADATARARYRVDDQGRHRFDVEIEGVPAGSYSLVVAGTVRGTIEVTSTSDGVQGEIEFDSKPEAGHRPLNFDPRGQLIDITSDAGTFFSHLLGSGSAATGGGAIPFEREMPLLSSGADAGATAKAKLERKSSGELKFEVEAEDLTPGAYDLLVGGVSRGTLNVVLDGDRSRGQLQYESEPEDGELLLDFEVAGEEILISQGGTAFFSRIFPAN